jgi:hypothetical protein
MPRKRRRKVSTMKCPYCNNDMTLEEFKSKMQITEGRLGYKAHYVCIFPCPKCDVIMEITSKM